MKTWEEFKQHDCKISTDSVSIDKRLYEQIQRDATAPLEQRIAIEERNHPFYKELVGDFEAALGPHPTIPNGQWIRRISELREQLEQSRKMKSVVLYPEVLKLVDAEVLRCNKLPRTRFQQALGGAYVTIDQVVNQILWSALHSGSKNESPSKCQ